MLGIVTAVILRRQPDPAAEKSPYNNLVTRQNPGGFEGNSLLSPIFLLPVMNHCA